MCSGYGESPNKKYRTRVFQRLDTFDKNYEMDVEVPRIRIGKIQTIETLINEEALLLAKLLRDEKKMWTFENCNFLGKLMRAHPFFS